MPPISYDFSAISRRKIIRFSAISVFRARRLNCGHDCAFECVDEAVSGAKPPAGKGVVGMLS